MGCFVKTIIPGLKEHFKDKINGFYEKPVINKKFEYIKNPEFSFRNLLQLEKYDGIAKPIKFLKYVLQAVSFGKEVNQQTIECAREVCKDIGVSTEKFKLG